MQNKHYNWFIQHIIFFLLQVFLLLYAIIISLNALMSVFENKDIVTVTTQVMS